MVPLIYQTTVTEHLDWLMFPQSGWVKKHRSTIQQKFQGTLLLQGTQKVAAFRHIGLIPKYYIQIYVSSQMSELQKNKQTLYLHEFLIFYCCDL